MPKRNGTGIALLADPTRLKIVELLAVRPRTPSDLARALGLSRPAVSRQLHILYDAGLIRDLPIYRDGRMRLFGLHPDNVNRIVAFLAGTEIALIPRNRPVQRRWARRDEPP
jgi:DNA-binding transcriptional ArsR family regulator